MKEKQGRRNELRFRRARTEHQKPPRPEIRKKYEKKNTTSPILGWAPKTEKKYRQKHRKKWSFVFILLFFFIFFFFLFSFVLLLLIFGLFLNNKNNKTTITTRTTTTTTMVIFGVFVGIFFGFSGPNPGWGMLCSFRMSFVFPALGGFLCSVRARRNRKERGKKRDQPLRYSKTPPLNHMLKSHRACMHPRCCLLT